MSDLLEVFESKVTITPKRTASAMIVRGLKGTKSIPFTSITAIQFREANPINGYIQFSILGGNESAGGVIAAISDENTCFFTHQQNKVANEIRDYIEARLDSNNKPTTITNIPDQLERLSELKKQGFLSEAEFSLAKDKLLKTS